MLHNPSYPKLLEELRAAAWSSSIPLPLRVRNGEVRYLMQDTHWTPQWMDEVCGESAKRVQQHLPVADIQSIARDIPAMRIERVTLRGIGDLAEMLNLTDRQTIFPPQEVTIDTIVDSSGRAIRPSPQSPVLLLGDSFTNIYSAKPMGWGEGAGLAEHIAYHLGQPIDWLARNDAGAHATGELLAAQQQPGRDRLSGKKIVVWQFASRELSLGDWKLLTASDRSK